MRLRSFTLNSAMGAGPETGRWLDLTELQDGSSLVGMPPVKGQGTFDENFGKVKGWMETGDRIQKSGSLGAQIVGDFPFAQALSLAAAGFAVGGPVGAAVGAAVAVIQWAISAFGPGPSRWDDAGPDVHWWFTNYGPQAYLDWLESTGNQAALGSVTAAARGLLMFQLQERNLVLWPDHETVAAGHQDNSYVYHAAGGLGVVDAGTAYAYVTKFYDDLGIDWAATRALYDAEGSGHAIMYKRRLVYPPGGGAPDDSAADGSGAGVAVAVGAAALALKLAL